jgi:FKBP-type peptidyl-prolyl cis-trans isomerase
MRKDLFAADGLQYYDLSTGDGKEVEEGNKVKVSLKY